MRRAWMIGGAILVAVALSATLFATASGKKPPQNGNQPRSVPASIELTPDPIAIQCDGVDATMVTVRVTDARGKAVPNGTEVFFDAVYGFVDPVVAETNRGEASTQARFYAYAQNYPGLTRVDVTVGPLRASIGIDCLPPAPPCGPDASPPCPTPVPCNAPFSPPMPFSPPCDPPLPCSDTDSPPVGTSPPCPTATPCGGVFSPPCGTPLPTATPSATPAPSCYPQSPPCDVCGPVGVFSPPCPPPERDGVIRFTSYDPITANVGQQIVVEVESAPGTDAFKGYQWLFVFPDFLGAFTEAIEPSHLFTLCAAPTNVGDSQPAYYGGCLDPENRFVDYIGPLTKLMLSCERAGTGSLALGAESTYPLFFTSYLGTAGASFGGPDPATIEITCLASN